MGNIGFYLHIEEKIYFLMKPILLHRKKKITMSERLGFYKSYKIINELLKDQPWLGGKELTIADLCCLATISTMDFIVPISESSFPYLKKYMKKCEVDIPHYEEINQSGIDLMAQVMKERMLINYI